MSLIHFILPLINTEVFVDTTNNCLVVQSIKSTKNYQDIPKFTSGNKYIDQCILYKLLSDSDIDKWVRTYHTTYFYHS